MSSFTTGSADPKGLAQGRKTQSLSEELSKYVKPAFLKWQEVKVSFGESVLLKDYCRFFTTVFNSRTNGSLTEEDLEAYLLTLLSMRINIVNGQTTVAEKRLSHVAIPAFWCSYLLQVGQVRDESYGLHISPEMVEGFESLDDLEFRRITEILTRGSNFMEMGFELPRKREGSFDFMTLQMVSEHVCSHSKEVDSTTAFMGSMLAISQAQQVFNPIVSYGKTAAMRPLVGSIVD